MAWSGKSLIIENAIALRVAVQGVSIGPPIGHPVGQHQGWPLSPWTLDLSIAGLNPMCDTALRTFSFSFLDINFFLKVESSDKSVITMSSEP